MVLVVDRLVLGVQELSRDALVAVVADQAAVIEGFVAQHEVMATQMGLLVKRNELLAAEVAELRRRLGLDSKNSGKPPSSDGLTKAAPKSSRKRSGRKPGKQPGAVGKTRERVADPDEIVEYRPDECWRCHNDLADAEVVDVVSRQSVDLPEIKPRVTEHRMMSCRCACGTVSSATPPDGVNAPVQYGPGLAALAVYLLVGHHVPFARVVRILSDLVGAAVSAGWVNDCLTRMAAALTGFRTQLFDALGRSSVVHFDETGTRVAGALRWVHVACTPLLTHYHLDDRRGQLALEADGVLPGMNSPQVAVHDGWQSYMLSPYRCVDHALCNAHHLREFTGWIDADPKHAAWATPLLNLLRRGKRLVDRAKSQGRDHLHPKDITDLREKWRQRVADAYAANPPPPGKRRGPIRALLNRLRDNANEIWRFTRDFTVPFDNNQAERDIRMVKLQNKISGTWRKTNRAKIWLQVREYISTATKNSIDTLTALRDALTGNAWLPPLPE